MSIVVAHTALSWDCISDQRLLTSGEKAWMGANSFSHIAVRLSNDLIRPMDALEAPAFGLTNARVAAQLLGEEGGREIQTLIDRKSVV